MGLYQQWPYTNFHELNLDWLLKEMKELTEHIENYVAELGIKYADPIDWDITTQYEQNTIVIEPNSGTAYMSLQPVPAGINITNTDYWTPVFTLGELIEGLREGTSKHVEETGYASQAYNAGDLIWVSHELVRALSNIAAGSAFNTGTGGNCESISVEEILAEHAADIITNANNIAASASDITTLQGTVTSQGSALTNLGGRMTTAEGNISANAADIANIQGQIGSLIQQKKFLFVGDSYGEGYTPDGMVTGWCNVVANYMGLNAGQYIISYYGGACFGNSSNSFAQRLTAVGADSAVTDIIVCGGYNDMNRAYADIKQGMQDFKTTAETLFPNAKVYVGFIGATGTSSNKPLLYRRICNAYIPFSAELGFSYLSGVEYAVTDPFTMLASDAIHPNQTGENAISRAIVNSYLNGYADIKVQDNAWTITASGSGSAFSSLAGTMMSMDNGIKTIANNALLEISCSFSQTANGHNFTEVGTFTGGLFTGDGFNHVVWSAPTVIKNSNLFYHVHTLFKIENKKLFVAFMETTSAHNNYTTFGSVTQIQVQPFSASFPTLLS